MPRSTIPPEIKAQALADLMDGDQPAVVAERYGLPSALVRKWKFRLGTPDGTESVPSGVPSPPPGRPVYLRSPQRDAADLAIADLIMQNLRAKLVATQRIAEYASSNTAWLEKQTAAELGELFESIDRSALSVLDRMAAAGRPAAAGGDEDPALPDRPRPDPVD